MMLGISRDRIKTSVVGWQEKNEEESERKERVKLCKLSSLGKEFGFYFEYDRVSHWRIMSRRVT